MEEKIIEQVIQLAPVETIQEIVEQQVGEKRKREPENYVSDNHRRCHHCGELQFYIPFLHALNICQGCMGFGITWMERSNGIKKKRRTKCTSSFSKKQLLEAAYIAYNQHDAIYIDTFEKTNIDK